MVGAEQLSRADVLAFLSERTGTPEDLEALAGGAWSSAWAYRAGGEELVVRGGPEESSPSVRAEPGARRDAAARHHCYELHIGFTHLGWNVWIGDQANLAATARRLAEVLERGPLPLTAALQ